MLTPAKIMQIGMGFWPSKVLLSAVKLGLFTELGAGPLSGAEIKQKLGLRCTDRHVFDWLDALVSLGLLEREGLLETAQYRSAADTGTFLDKNQKTYMGGILEMADSRLFRHWANLSDGLISGTPQNESKDKTGGGNMGAFEELYTDPHALHEFIEAMAGFQAGNFAVLVAKFDFGKFESMLDVGGADGSLSIQVCQRYPGITCTTFDLPPVEPLAKTKIATFGLSGRIDTSSGDLMADPFPPAQFITMGNILHGFDEAAKQSIINKVYESLPDGGAFMAVENIIDNDRRQNTFGMLMSLNMLIENGEAFDYTPNDFEHWAKTAGFKRVEILPLAGPTSAVIAYK
jgi:hypothetical protein